MSNEKLKDALSDKMHREQDKFKEELLQKPPEDILRDAYAYWVRENIMMAANEYPLSNAQLSALLKLDDPLSAAYQEFLHTDHNTLEPLADSLESLADTELRAADAERLAAEKEAERPSIREQLRTGGSRSAQEHAGKPPTQER